MTNKLTLIATVALIICGFTACKNKASEDARLEATSFNTYVDSINGVTHVYTEENWQAIDRDYNERVARLEAQISNMEAEDKAKAEESKAKYAALRANYESNLAKAKAETTMTTDVDSRQVLRDRLFGEGKVAADMQFSFVTPANVLGIYETFVNTVETNKDAYSREDWDEIKVLYEALDTRKNEIEKEMDGADNRKIAGLKVKFARIKAANRPGTKGDENAEAKKNN
jgi:hypothetical protein